MRLLVLGSGMMGSAAAYDMARSVQVEAVTLADADRRRASASASTINRLCGGRKVRATAVDAADRPRVARLMGRHDATLSCVPYFNNYGLAQAALEAGCHFADLGGNSDVVRRELALDGKAAKRGVRLAPDCGLSPGLASILAGELLRAVGGRADALKIYVGGLPLKPRPPFHYELVFSVEGLINEYAEPAKILRRRKLTTVEPLTELERFHIRGLPELEAFHTSGGTSTLPESFAGRVGECFEKTLRYPGHAAMIRALYDFGLFSKEPRQIGQHKVVPRALMAGLMLEKFASYTPADRSPLRAPAQRRPARKPAFVGAEDLTVMRIEAVAGKRIESFTLIDRFDRRTGMTAMMRTTAWPASIVVQMLASGEISKTGAILQERDVPVRSFLKELAARGIAVKRQSKRNS